MFMRGQRDEIPPGTLEMLILKTLSAGTEMHGFQIAESIERVSGDVLRVEEGSLYPALQRMLIQGWIKGEWSKTEEKTAGRGTTASPRTARSALHASWSGTGASLTPSLASCNRPDMTEGIQPPPRLALATRQIFRGAQRGDPVARRASGKAARGARHRTKGGALHGTTSIWQPDERPRCGIGGVGLGRLDEH
jgi:hypothetical protein